MEINLTEIEILQKINEGMKNVKEIAIAIKKDLSWTYKVIDELEEKGLLEKKGKMIELNKQVFLNKLLIILKEFPNIKDLIKNSGINILTSLLEPKSIENIKKYTDYNKSIIYEKIKQGINLSIIKKEKNKYFINKKLWSKLEEFLFELKNYEESIDRRIPLDSKIYYKKNNQLIFSNDKEIDASLTSFSVYGEFGIEILSPIKYYFIPKKRLSKKEIFIHSLMITEKEKSIRDIISLSIFYVKFQGELKRIKHSILENIKEVLSGKKLENYPSLNDIKEKAEIYGVKI